MFTKPFALGAYTVLTPLILQLKIDPSLRTPPACRTPLIGIPAVEAWVSDEDAKSHLQGGKPKDSRQDMKQDSEYN